MEEEFQPAKFDLRRSYIFKLAGKTDPIAICEILRDMLVDAKYFFMTPRTSYEAFLVLRKAMYAFEEALIGNESPDLFNSFYNLGSMLITFGNNDLGLAFHLVHHVFGFRPVMQWPTSKVWNMGRGDELAYLLPFAEDYVGPEEDTKPNRRAVSC